MHLQLLLVFFNLFRCFVWLRVWRKTTSLPSHLLLTLKSFWPNDNCFLQQAKQCLPCCPCKHDLGPTIVAEDIIVFTSIDFTITEILYLFEWSLTTWPAFKLYAAFQSNVPNAASWILPPKFPFLISSYFQCNYSLRSLSELGIFQLLLAIHFVCFKATLP